MKKIFLIFALFLPIITIGQNVDSVTIRKVFIETLTNGKAYSWLQELTKEIGARLSGSPEAEKSVEWSRKKMMEAGADTVYLQEVIVPNWVRGSKESAFIIEANGNKTEVPVLALGNSVSTSPEGLAAEIIEVNDFTQLKILGKEKIAGKIIFYNTPFDETLINPFEAYSETVKYRWAGASEAAKYGAVGTVCRSLTNINDDFPHTGSMRYKDSIPKIPCCAISTNGANLLSRILRANKSTRFFFRQDCHFLDSAKSYNVIAEIKGRVLPKEYITVGAHLDSWDVGEGAHDDGAGIVQSIEIIRTLKALNLKPRRTIRIVAFMNEENGLRGGKKYAQEARDNNEKHIAAIESDAGGYAPIGFGMTMTDEQKNKVKRYKDLFLPYGMYDFESEGDGADISELYILNVPRLGLLVSPQRYFEIHHAGSDTFDKVNKRELLLGSAAMASIAWLFALYGL